MFKHAPLSIAMLLVFSQASLAQSEDEAAKKSAAAELENVVVTGSNIKGANLEGAVPVITITQKEIQATGATTVIEFLAKLPQARGGVGTFGESNSGAKQGDTPAGAAGISLRGLGTAATLTLINGRRITASSFANGSESFVDVNAIPLAAIERVEVLTTGASAIYGADAVAGVVNFILKKNYEGFEVATSIGESAADSDDTKSSLNVLYGVSDERASLLAYFDYFKRNALYDRDRPETAIEPRPSEQGIFPSFNLDPRLRQLDLTETACPTLGSGRLGQFCALNRNAYTVTVPATERLGAGVTFNYDLGGGMNWFNEFLFQQNRAKTNSEPAPWSGEDIAINHPGIPAELGVRLDRNAADIRTQGRVPRLRGWGRFTEAREIEVLSQSFRLLSGLNGTLANGMSWEAAINHSESESTQQALQGIFNVARFRAALNGRLCADGRTTCTPTTGGIFYNPFRGQANSTEVLNLLRERVPRYGRSELSGIDAKISGEAGATWAGPMQFAVGFESRYENVRDNPDALATANPITGDVPVYGFGSTQAQAGRSQLAAYAELLIPLHETVEMQLAGRFDRYSDFGSDFNPKVSIRWQPLEQVVVRGGWSTAFRAPSLAQVGAGTTLSSGALPCAAGSEFFSTFCGGFAGDDSYLSEIYGNQGLSPETATTWNFGVAFDPIESITLSADYWNFKHKDLVAIDAIEVFRSALRNPGLVVDVGRLNPGQIGIETRGGRVGDPVENVQLNLINVGEQRTDGFDFASTWRLPETALGDFRLTWDATYINSFKRFQSGSNTLQERAGFFRYPRILSDARVSWDLSRWDASLGANYTHRYKDDDTRAGVPIGREIPAWTQVDAKLGYEFNRQNYLYLGVTNLFDRAAPIALGSGTNVDLFNHDTMGRYYRLSYVFTL